ncbi:MAG: threonine synthase [bacterium]|nr:threonine synthase [bacterium]
MLCYSTSNKSLRLSMREAILQGLAPDGGLFMPVEIPSLSPNVVSGLRGKSMPEIGFIISKLFLSEDVGDADLRAIVEEAINFPAPLVSLDEQTKVLELHHGPTLAFKDFGARFMSRLMGHFLRNESQKVTILVATSGDTGSAVAHGFLGVEGIDVVLLYPRGMVSPLQEKQFTTLGQNITALEVDGTFDDCQKLVKQAFVDAELQKARPLASANSINLARLIPQSFYYAATVSQLALDNIPLVFSVPSGNFGNLTAGIIAKKIGFPIRAFIAATNSNDVVPQYIKSGVFAPRPSLATISNAMDVGNPSNFDRLREIFSSSLENFRAVVSGASFSDNETREAMILLKDKYNYLMDPHGAVAWLGWKQYQNQFPGAVGVVLETAHPAKFREVVEETLNLEVPLPAALEDCMNREKKAVPMENSYSRFSEFLRTSTIYGET